MFCGWFQFSKLSSVTQQLEEHLFHDFTYSKNKSGQPLFLSFLCPVSYAHLKIQTPHELESFFCVVQFDSGWFCWLLCVCRAIFSLAFAHFFPERMQVNSLEYAVGKQSDSSMTLLFCFAYVFVDRYHEMSRKLVVSESWCTMVLSF